MDESKRLKNEDFRKLLATPHHAAPSASKSSVISSGAGSHQDSSHAFTHRKTGGPSGTGKKKPQKNNYKPGRSEKFDGNKEADLYDESDADLNEILKHYRDRAAERRKALASDETAVELKLMGGSKELIGSVLEASTTEERNMQIQKSKYLGGDMEHTHLVKGLDYSLLNRIRSEIQEDELAGKEHGKMTDPAQMTSNETSRIGNKLSRNLCKILFESKPPQRNDLFVRGRMAYLVDLDDEESEVPSTLLRSVGETQMDQQSSENINADNLLINKLSQVLAYLRADVKKKKKIPDRDGQEKEQQQIQQAKSSSIFDGVDEYNPSMERKKRAAADEKRQQQQSRREPAEPERRTTYFDSNSSREREKQEKERSREQQRMERKRQQEEEEERRRVAEKEEMLQKKKRKLEEEEAYAELYPGGLGIIDAGGESDDDDFTKMDQGNRKPQVKRWDFENQEDYEKYQSQREANPRAAFQYGVKTSGGRKTRKNISAANERKIDRELDKINKILEKGVSKNIRY